MKRGSFISAFAVAAFVSGVMPALAQEWVMVCAEGSRPCPVDGTRMIQYGANGAFNFAVATNLVVCSNETFGDPAPGVGKACWYRATAREQSLGALVSERDKQILQLREHVASLERDNIDLRADLANVNAELKQISRPRAERRPPPRRDRPR